MTLNDYQKSMIDNQIGLSFNADPAYVRVDILLCLERLGFTDSLMNRTSPILEPLRQAIIQYIKTHPKLRGMKETATAKDASKFVYVFVKN